MSEVLVVGSLAYDSVKTPHGKAQKSLGGSANYFAVSASLLAPVRVVGVVGTDYSDSDRAILANRKVDLSGVQIMDGQTFHWEGSYENNLNEAVTLKTELNVFGHFDPKLPPEYRKSSFVFLANIDPELQLKVLDQIEHPKFVGMDSMNFWINSKQNELIQVMKKVDIVFMNETEIKMLTQKNNVFEAIKDVHAMGVNFVVIKRGEYGSVLSSKAEGYFFCSVLPVEKVVDPTGAGDSFAGGFFGYLVENCSGKPTWKNLKQAVLSGTVMSSKTIQDFSMKSLLSLDQSQFKELRQQLVQSVSL